MKRPVKPKQGKTRRAINTVGELRNVLLDKEIPDDADLYFSDYMVEFPLTDNVYQEKVDTYQRQMIEYKKFKLNKLKKEIEDEQNARA